VRLAVAGDVGTGDSNEFETGAAMADYEGEHEFDALPLLGDNVYPSGDEARLVDSVFRPFREVLERGTHLVAVLGNHDVRDGNAEPQMKALGMPGRWYAWRDGSVLVIARLHTPERSEPASVARVRVVDDRRDVEDRIAAPPSVLRRPAWFVDQRARRLRAVVRRVRRAARAVGSDHDYQRSEPMAGTTYVVSGAAAKTRPTGQESFTAASWSMRHFLDVSIWADRLELRAIGQDTLVYDSVELTADG
jgi:hypothetical protein